MSCKKQEKRVFLGYTFDQRDKKFVKVWYEAFQSPDFEPCSVNDVDFNRFIHPHMADWLYDCERDEQIAYFNAVGFDDNFIKEIENHDLRCVADFIWKLTVGKADLNPVSYRWARDILKILPNRISTYFPDFKSVGESE